MEEPGADVEQVEARQSDRDRALRLLLTPLELDMLGRAERLSPQERAVFVLLGRGMQAKAVGFELALSVKTVETHIARLRVKIGGDRPVLLPDLMFLARMWVRAAGV